MEEEGGRKGGRKGGKKGGREEGRERKKGRERQMGLGRLCTQYLIRLLQLQQKGVMGRGYEKLTSRVVDLTKASIQTRGRGSHHNSAQHMLHITKQTMCTS